MKSFKPALLVIGLCAIALVPALALAATPQTGGRYSGKSRPILGYARHSVVITISGSGTRGTIRYCGDRRGKSVKARFKMRKGGKFKATRHGRRGKTRFVNFQATGRFTSKKRVTGRIVVVFKCDHNPGTYVAKLTS